MHNYIIQQNHDYFKKYTRIYKLQNKIDKLRQNNRPRIRHFDNCKRCNHRELHPRYVLNFHTVSSSTVRKQATFKHITSSTGRREITYNLCNQCNEYLVNKKKEENNIWPSFLWNILSMGNKSDFIGEYKYYSVYSGQHFLESYSFVYEILVD